MNHKGERNKSLDSFSSSQSSIDALNLNSYLPREYSSNFPLSNDSRRSRIDSITSVSSTTSGSSRHQHHPNLVPTVHTYTTPLVKSNVVSMQSVIQKWTNSVPKLFKYPIEDLQIIYHRKDGKDELYRKKKRKKNVEKLQNHEKLHENQTEEESIRPESDERESKKPMIEEKVVPCQSQNIERVGLGEVENIAQCQSELGSKVDSNHQVQYNLKKVEEPEYNSLFGNNVILTPVEIHPMPSNMSNECEHEEEFQELRDKLHDYQKENIQLKKQIRNLSEHLRVIKSKEKEIARDVNELSLTISNSEMNGDDSDLSKRVMKLLTQTTPNNSPCPSNSTTPVPVPNSVSNFYNNNNIVEKKEKINYTYQGLQARINALYGDGSSNVSPATASNSNSSTTNNNLP